ncbi:mechanosensitive ion channel domain-containing protein [uncultured Halomonas sp.]|uniref:mechanosensitive ion channel family protein n=1 Tax=uncultured Halomonas sp. TaxID=173971 RepID=UPI00261B1154|nr:mechanosensitive ion channel domain-containing protein [uncultured Halomonas sp.]
MTRTFSRCLPPWRRVLPAPMPVLFWVLMSLALLLAGPVPVQSSQHEDGPWFTLETLNSGLGEPPEKVRRQTPREALRSFLTLSGKGDFEAAAHLLNLTELPAQEQATRGSELARQLASVLQRGDWLQPSDLSSRRDAMVEDMSGKHPLAGQARRNLLLTSLEADGESHAIRIARYQAGDQEPVWLITPDTLAFIPVLYKAYGPSWLERHIPEPFQRSLGMLRLWEWLAIPLFLTLIGLLGWAVYRLTSAMAGWLPAGSLAKRFVARVPVPVTFIAMSLMAQVLLGTVVSFSGVATAGFRILLIVIMAWGMGLAALRLVDAFLQRMTQRLVGEIDDTRHRDERKLLTSLYALRRGIILITVIAVTVYILAEINLFGTLGLSLLASASVLTVLVGIAGQAVLGNILSSFQLSLAKPIRMGDLVVFEGQWCYVEGIFYTFIRLRGWDERRLIVPVKHFVSQPFYNLSAKDARLYRQLALTLHISADIECLRQRFQELAEQEPDVIEPDKLCCYATAQNEATIEVRCYMMTREPMGGWVAEARLREKLLAFIRDEHPEWWPREVVAVSRRDVTIAEGGEASFDSSQAGEGHSGSS